MMLQTVLILIILLDVMVGLENVNGNYCPKGEHYKALADRECAKLSLESLIMRLLLTFRMSLCQNQSSLWRSSGDTASSSFVIRVSQLEISAINHNNS